MCSYEGENGWSGQLKDAHLKCIPGPGKRQSLGSGLFLPLHPANISAGFPLFYCA